MTTVPLNVSVTARLSGAGAGTAQLGPTGARETWNLQVASVSVSTNMAEAVCKIYLGPSATQDNFTDGTFSGSSGDSTDRVASWPLTLGNYCWAVWAGGDAGATAILTVTGTKDI